MAIPKEAECTFAVVKEGFAEGRFAGIKTGTEDARFVLSDYGVVSGRVTKSDRSPAAGVVVGVIAECAYDPNAAQRFSLPIKEPKQTTLTNDEGRYRLEGLSPDVAYDLGVFDLAETELRQTWRDHCLKPLAYKQGVHVEAGHELSDVDFRLLDNPYVHLSGHVRDEATGAPTVKLGLGCSLINPYKFLTVATTDGAGAYTLEFTLNEKSNVMVNGTYLSLLGGLGAPLKRAGGEQTSTLFPVSPGDSIEIDFVVDAPIQIPVRVVDGTGNPVPGINVGLGFVQADGRWDYAGANSIPADGSGLCVLSGLPPNRAYFVWAQRTTQSGLRGVNPTPLAEQGPIQGAPGETTAEVVLCVDAKGGVEGILVDAEGNPVANASVAITASRPGDTEPQSTHGVTKDDGRFVVVFALAPGTYPEITIGVMRDGNVLQAQVEDIEIVQDSVVSLGVIPLVPNSDGAQDSQTPGAGG